MEIVNTKRYSVYQIIRGKPHQASRKKDVFLNFTESVHLQDGSSSKVNYTFMQLAAKQYFVFVTSNSSPEKSSLVSVALSIKTNTIKVPSATLVLGNSYDLRNDHEVSALRIAQKTNLAVLYSTSFENLSFNEEQLMELNRKVEKFVIDQLLTLSGE